MVTSEFGKLVKFLIYFKKNSIGLNNLAQDRF